MIASSKPTIRLQASARCIVHNVAALMNNKSSGIGSSHRHLGAPLAATTAMLASAVASGIIPNHSICGQSRPNATTNIAWIAAIAWISSAPAKGHSGSTTRHAFRIVSDTMANNNVCAMASQAKYFAAGYIWT